ncbi:MAG: hypothetical protein EX285_03945 [Thaumarchaeota archaeon]|nr:hypothetical protein [Nitrososphaerota archaeon]
MKISKGVEEDMSSLTYERLPYVKFGDYQSKDRLHPDVLNITIMDKETFESTYSTNARIKLDGKDCYLPLQNKNSKSETLVELWKNEVVDNPAIKIGSDLVLYTWLGKSTRNKQYDIRRFAIFDANQNSIFSGVS